MSKPILCLDFDGVIHSYASGWQGVTNIPDPPVEGVFEFLEEATKHFNVHIFSSRSKLADGMQAMVNWLNTHFHEWRRRESEVLDILHDDFISDIKFSTQKPPAKVTLDDRAITFTGTWPSMKSLIEFEPWHKGKDNYNTPEYEQASQACNTSDDL